MVADLHPRLRELPGFDVPPSGRLTHEQVMSLPGVKEFVAGLVTLINANCNAEVQGKDETRKIS